MTLVTREGKIYRILNIYMIFLTRRGNWNNRFMDYTISYLYTFT